MSISIHIATHQTAWDNYIADHPKASPYHKFAWLQAIEEAYQHKNISLIAIENHNVVGVMPCIAMNRPFGKTKFCALPFCDIGYAIADTEEITKALQHNALSLLADSKGSIFEYRDTESQVTDQQIPSQKVRMLMPLPQTAEILFDGFKSKLRSQIRKAEKNGLTCSINNNQQAIDNFYLIFAKNMRKLGSPVHSKKWFEALVKHYKDDLFLGVVYKQSTPVGAGIILRNSNKIAIPWASTDADYNYLAPNMMLYWSLLKHACDLGCSQFDFGRSTFGEGTYKFKQQWGAEPVPLIWSDLANHNPDVNSAVIEKSILRTTVETIWSHLPLGLTTLIGPQIRKHISL
jgi:FemAB-related protein (PEP-CTERM system-associated)